MKVINKSSGCETESATTTFNVAELTQFTLSGNASVAVKYNGAIVATLTQSSPTYTASALGEYELNVSPTCNAVAVFADEVDTGSDVDQISDCHGNDAVSVYDTCVREAVDRVDDTLRIINASINAHSAEMQRQLENIGQLITDVISTIDDGIDVSATQAGEWEVTVTNQLDPVEVADEISKALDGLNVNIAGQDTDLNVNVTNGKILVEIDNLPVIPFDVEVRDVCLDVDGSETKALQHIIYNEDGTVRSIYYTDTNGDDISGGVVECNNEVVNLLQTISEKVGDGVVAIVQEGVTLTVIHKDGQRETLSLSEVIDDNSTTLTTTWSSKQIDDHVSIYDQTLQASIDAEEQARTDEDASIREDFAQADQTLQASIDAEEQARTDEDASIREDFAQADQTLQAAIDAIVIPDVTPYATKDGVEIGYVSKTEDQGNSDSQKAIARDNISAASQQDHSDLKTRVDERFDGSEYAASRKVGTSNGDVAIWKNGSVEDTGVGGKKNLLPTHRFGNAFGGGLVMGEDRVEGELPPQTGAFNQYFTMLHLEADAQRTVKSQIMVAGNVSGGRRMFFRSGYSGISSEAGSPWSRDSWCELWHDKNTKLDTNGALAPSSPTIDLYSDRIEPNDDGSRMKPEFIRNGVGDYTIKNTTGLRKNDGWYIKVPNDKYGNPKVLAEIDEQENGDLNIKTYGRKFDFEIAGVVPDLDNPQDIPEGRWIDLRFNELPEEELEEP